MAMNCKTLLFIVIAVLCCAKPSDNIGAQREEGEQLANYRGFGYTLTYQLRDGPAGRSVSLNKTHVPTPKMYFPNRKVGKEEDTFIREFWNKLPDSGYDPNVVPRLGPELEHITDHNCQPFFGDATPVEHSMIGGNPFKPLDSNDFVRPQFTRGSVNTGIIAGFYDPSLLIVGDTDMKHFHLLRWKFDSLQGFDVDTGDNAKCLLGGFYAKDLPKPIYSMYEMTDPDYWINHYRMRYFPRSYNEGYKQSGIFGVAAMKDRFVLITTKGLLTVYADSDEIAATGKAGEVEYSDTLNRCFKILRVARRASYTVDTIMGITYDYQHGNENINQEIWIGKFQQIGKPLNWAKLNHSATQHSYLEELVYGKGNNRNGPGAAGMSKQPVSEIEAICYKAYRSNMGSTTVIELVRQPGWCEAVDATPVVAVDHKIQVLVRMRTYFSSSSEKQEIVFYVIASIITNTATVQVMQWKIDSIIPRIPCVDDHKESIPNVANFDSTYFKKKSGESTVEGKHGCHRRETRLVTYNKIYLHGMTYTRSFKHHMFLYGNKLLQSRDGGKTFITLRSFPVRSPRSQYMCRQAAIPYHRITLMAFDDLGHYAFLTSKRELWYGNLGSLEQVRLRPGRLFGVTMASLIRDNGIREAVPFSIFFDTNNELVEMVAVVDVNGVVTRIARREVSASSILQSGHLLQKETAVRETLTHKLQNIAVEQNSEQNNDEAILKKMSQLTRFNQLSWSVFCPFSSAGVFHNFSFALAYAEPSNLLPRIYNETGLYIWQDKYILTQHISRAYPIDYGTVIRIDFEFSISDDLSLNRIDYVTEKLSDIEINVENADVNILKVDMRRKLLPSRAGTQYTFYVSVIRNETIKQQRAGESVLYIPLDFHLLGGFGKCAAYENEGVHGDLITTTFAVGCPPELKLSFNAEGSLLSLNFRDISAQYGLKPDECYNKETTCFYAKLPVVLNFNLDGINIKSRNFTSYYTMRVIAGGFSKNNLKQYTKEQQDAFNVPGVSDSSLIWTVWDTESQQSTSGRIGETKEVILKSGVTAIQWACHTLSPCARLSPRPNMQTIYHFKIRVSNRDVDNSTLCLFEEEFDILLYGFPPSPEIQLITTLLCAFVVFLIVYIAFFCLREEKKVWITTTILMTGWIQVIKQTLPTWLCSKPTEENKTEARIEKQNWKDNVILSLQGHLNVPNLVRKPATAAKHRGSVIESEKSKSDIITATNSSASIKTFSSVDSRAVLSPLTTRPEATTWADLIHEQVISRRLASIIERNRKKTEALKRKAAREQAAAAAAARKSF